MPIANYNDELIKKIYCMRWDVEVFFKLVKSNFNFAYLREHNSNLLLIILINIIKIIKLFLLIFNNKKPQVKRLLPFLIARALLKN